MTCPKTTTTAAAPKAPPNWEIFLVGEDGRVLERTWEDKERGTRGIAWDKRGALWADTTREGRPTLSGYLDLPDGQHVRLKLFPPRPSKGA